MLRGVNNKLYPNMYKPIHCCFKKAIFGFDDNKIMTLEEVGKILGVTRERIRQIERKALRKLKHPKRSKELINFVKEI